MERITKITNLPELPVFSEIKGIEPAEQVDLLLANIKQPICCLATQENLRAATAYKQILVAGGKSDKDIVIEQVDDPVLAVSQQKQQDGIFLVISDATDPTLKDRMFIDGPSFGQLFMSHVYVPRSNHQSPDLFAVGIEKQGLETLNQQNVLLGANQSVIEEMRRVRKIILGESVVANDDFREILKSKAVNTIIAHALGPAGTNISQAMRQYLERLGVQDKSHLIVHPRGIEPLDYAKMAAAQIQDGVLPIHMECAVYYNMGKLFDLRTEEVVFADHHYMPLDAMQLASIKEMEELALSGIMRIAAHPSPQPLINSWIGQGKVQWIRATSNSAAAEMVMNDEVDACITTATSLNGKNILKTRHQFGSPMMLFTIGTPLNQQQLKVYLERLQ